LISAAAPCSFGVARADGAARSAWTPGAGRSSIPGLSCGSSCPSGRCSASSAVRHAAAPGQAPLPERTCAAAPSERASAGASRRIAVVSSQGAPEGAGLRIDTPPEGAPEGGLEAALGAVAAEGDEVIDEGGAHVFVESRRPRRSRTSFSTRRSSAARSASHSASWPEWTRSENAAPSRRRPTPSSRRRSVEPRPPAGRLCEGDLCRRRAWVARRGAARPREADRARLGRPRKFPRVAPVRLRPILPPERAAPVAVPAGPAKPVPRPESCMRTFGTHTVDTRAREAATSAYAAGVGSR
jgi:hypothetical protein